MLALCWMLLLATAAGYGTLILGWWALPLAALVGTVAAPRGTLPLVSVPLGAAVGWGALLLRSSRAEAFPQLLTLLPELLPATPRTLAVATLGLAVLLGLGAALLGVALRPVGAASGSSSRR